MADPVDNPLHTTFVWEVILELKTTAGSVIVAPTVVVQLFASVTVTVYAPATNAVAVSVV